MNTDAVETKQVADSKQPSSPSLSPRIKLEEASSSAVASLPPAASKYPSVDDDDDETTELSVSKAPHRGLKRPFQQENDEDDDDGVQLLGTIGENALVDFPHAREYCVVHPFAKNPVEYCPNCYCFVCDEEASKCKDWQQHCHAQYSSPKWQHERAHRKGAVGTSAHVASVGASQYSYSWRGPSVKELLESVTRIYPHEVTPPPPFVTALRHYQKQSLAFMMHVEENESIKSGWLCADVGMGKSAIVLALVVANPLPAPERPTLETVMQARYNGSKVPVKVKATVIFTSLSLLGQWEDEIRQHAPDLVVYRYHPASGYKLKMAMLFDADIIVSAATFQWTSMFVRTYQFHRVVLDESHLLGTPSARLECARSLVADRHWCVTATPFTSSLKELASQCKFLGLNEWEHCSTPDLLRRRMIRHVKSQLIDGSVALALPAATTSVRLVSMSTREESIYYKSKPSRFNCWEQKRIDHVFMKWYAPLVCPLISLRSSKIAAFMADLKQMLEQEPSMRAVVMTQFREQQDCIEQGLVEEVGLKVYTCHGGTDTNRRHRYIREFQSLEHPGPAVFLITMRVGSVGITLTAASHVFLMEPCLHPAMEFQAAGRIHRLGQTKAVGVTKYVYKGSCESRIIKLHEQIQQGRELIDGSNRLGSGAWMVLRTNEEPTITQASPW